MKRIYDYKADQLSSDPYTLLIEAGRDHCSYAFLNESTMSLDRLHYVIFDEREAEELLLGELRSLVETNFSKIFFSSAFPQAILAPLSSSASQAEALQLLYDLPDGDFLIDSIPEWQLAVHHVLLPFLHDFLKTSFPGHQLFHAFTPGIKIYNGSAAESQISIDFASRFFRLIVKNHQKILLGQTYEYTSPMDVVYYLLRICEEHDMESIDVNLILSGFIEKNSALYQELNKYFLQIQFVPSPKYHWPAPDISYHYFNSLYNLAACAS